MTFYNNVDWAPHKDTLSKDKDTVRPYRELIDAHLHAWDAFPEETSVPFAPYLTVQWDPRPWWGASNAHSIRYESPTPAEFASFLTEARQRIDASPKYRIPTQDGHGVKAVFLCAWNELAEGSILAPTKGDGDRRVKAMRQVFAKEKRERREDP